MRTQRGVLALAVAFIGALPALAIRETFTGSLDSSLPWTFVVPGGDGSTSEDSFNYNYDGGTFNTRFNSFMFQPFNFPRNILTLPITGEPGRNWEAQVQIQTRFSNLGFQSNPFGAAGLIMLQDADNYITFYVGRNGADVGLNAAGEVAGNWFFMTSTGFAPANDDDIYRIKIARIVPAGSTEAQLDVFFYRNGVGVGDNGGYQFSLLPVNPGFVYDFFNNLNGGKRIGMYTDSAANVDASSDPLSVSFDNFMTNVPTAGSRTVSGKITLQDTDPSWTPVGLETSVDYVQNGAVVASELVTLDAEGKYYLTTTLPNGNYDLHVKAANWLRKKQAITLGSGSLSNVNLSLINGDIDGDDSITIFDYIEISNGFDTVAGDPGYSYFADLDKDLSITIFDYIILSNNFDLGGDVLP